MSRRDSRTFASGRLERSPIIPVKLGDVGLGHPEKPLGVKDFSGVVGQAPVIEIQQVDFFHERLERLPERRGAAQIENRGPELRPQAFAEPFNSAGPPDLKK